MKNRIASSVVRESVSAMRSAAFYFIKTVQFVAYMLMAGMFWFSFRHLWNTRGMDGEFWLMFIIVAVLLGVLWYAYIPRGVEGY